MKLHNISLLIVASFYLSACATNSRDKILQGMFIAGTVGAVYGLSKEEKREENAAMYAGVAAATAGVIGLLVANPDTEAKRLREEIAYLKNQRELEDASKLIGKSPATFSGQIPDKYRSMVRPGEWRVYDTDQWIEDGDNRLIHQDKVMELIPPSLVPRR